MGWWSDLFNSGSQKPPFRNPTIEPDKPWPRGTKDGGGVSEPIISFVETVRSSPKRFTAWSDFEMFGEENYYFIFDKQTKELFQLGKGHMWPQGPHPITVSPKLIDWLTWDEKNYLLINISSVYEERTKRKTKIATIRKQRRDLVEKARLTNIYKDSTK